MRSLLIALLIVFFAGVHTAAALGTVHAMADANAHSTSLDHDMPDMAEMSDMAEMADIAVSRHHGCCENAGKTGPSGKTSSCSADCASFYADSIVQLFSADGIPESTPLQKLSALKPSPIDQPPKHN